jgi:hypothetical protein
VNGEAYSMYSKISRPGGLEISHSSLDEPLKGLFLRESLFKL